MNCREHAAVSGDLFFAAGLGHGLSADGPFLAVVCRNNAFDPAGGFGTLYLCDLQEVRRRVRPGFDKNFAAPYACESV